MRKRRLFKAGDRWCVQHLPICYVFNTWEQAAKYAWDNKLPD